VQASGLGLKERRDERSADLSGMCPACTIPSCSCGCSACSRLVTLMYRSGRLFQAGAGLKVGAPEEDAIHRNVVGRNFNNPHEGWPPVIRPFPLDRIVKARDCRSDRPIQPLSDGLQIRHQPPEPVFDVGVVRRRFRRLSPCVPLIALGIARTPAG
jgi:hypothetical protein